jgi:hypothetical protein
MKKTYKWIYQSIGRARHEQMKKTHSWIPPVPVDRVRSAEGEELSKVAQSPVVKIADVPELGESMSKHKRNLQ